MRPASRFTPLGDRLPDRSERRAIVEFETSIRMLCINEKMKPGPYGPYTSTPPAKLQVEPL